MTTPNKQWHQELEELAITSPDTNRALFNLPQLKGFISENFIPKSELDKIVVEEINIARSEGERTSRLTSLYMKINGKPLESDLIDRKELLEWLEGEKIIPVEVPHHNPYLTGVNSALFSVIEHILDKDNNTIS